jgi:signal peptide peptidase SppA
MNIRHVRAGEVLAIDANYLRQSQTSEGPGAFFWLFAAPIKATEYREDGVAVIHVRGPLEHHEDPCSDSYDDILCRAEEAFACEEARAVVLCLDSPGGVVAGLNATVDKLRKCAKESGKRFVAYVDEMATSAAYALACSCDEIVVPQSAITGSIGVISTMVDVTAADEMMGIRYVTIASGSRKTDGHPHVPITDSAVTSEGRRVEKLAMQFFRMVKSSRGVPVEKIRSFQAGIFLGKEALRAGLADAVMPYDELMATLSDTAKNSPRASVPTKPLAPSGQAEPHSVAANGTQAAAERTMPLSLDALIKRTEAALASEKDNKRKAELTASLEAYKKTKHSIEKHETEEGDEEDEEEEEADGNETDRGDDPDKDEDDDDEEDEKKSAAAPSKKSAKSKTKGKYSEEEAESEDDEAEALVTLVRRATGKTGAAAMGALEGLLSKARSAEGLAARVQAMEQARKTETRDSVVDRALAANRITKKEAVGLKKKPLAHVEAFLEARPRGLVYSQSEDLPVPQMQNPDGSSILPADLEKQIQAAITASEGKITREQILAEHAKRSQASLNGRS